MEKSTAGSRKFAFGLLTLLLLELAGNLPLAHAALSWSYIQTLRFHKMDGYYFTMTDCAFTLDIEGCSPETVLVYSNDVPQGVSFVSSRKEAFSRVSEDGRSVFGTHLIIWFRFEKTGSYQIRPLDVRVDGQYWQIPIDSVFVYENPTSVRPILSMKVDAPNNIQAAVNQNRPININAGEHLTFTLYIQYAVQIVGVSWDIPENSVFTHVHDFEITQGKSRGTEFSPQLVPVATFDWQPLISGTYDWPRIDVVATSYNGRRYSVALPSYSLQVQPMKEGLLHVENSQIDDSVLGYAFSRSNISDMDIKENQAEVRNLDELLQLYKKERHSLPLVSAATKNRQEAEAKEGLVVNPIFPSVPLFILLIVFAIFSLILTIVFIFLKKNYFAIFSAIICTVFIISLSIEGFRLSFDYALFAGGSIYRIPETDSRTTIQIPVGSVIKIERFAGDWIFIHYNETYGWIPKDAAVIIE